MQSHLGFSVYWLPSRYGHIVGKIRDKKSLVFCDNLASVAVLQFGRARDSIIASCASII